MITIYLKLFVKLSGGEGIKLLRIHKLIPCHKIDSLVLDGKKEIGAIAFPIKNHDRHLINIIAPFIL